MTVEFNASLQKRYSNQTREATPSQIQNQISVTHYLDDLSKETGINNLVLLKTIYYPDGEPIAYKIKNFIDSLKEFREKYDGKAETMLEYLDERSFRTNGRIIENRLRKRYKKFNISK